MQGKNYAAQAAMLCEKIDFQRFLCELVQVDTMQDDWTAQALRTLAQVESRRDFNTPEGAEKWFQIRTMFTKWKHGEANENGRPLPPFLMGQRAFERGSDISDNPFPRTPRMEYDSPRKNWKDGWIHRRAIENFTNSG